MTALGAITGEAVSGIAVGAISGWIFLIFACAGVVTGLKIYPQPQMVRPGLLARAGRPDRRRMTAEGSDQASSPGLTRRSIS